MQAYMQTFCSNFWHSDFTDNCESAHDYVFDLTCVCPYTSDKIYVLAIIKTVIEKKPQMQKFSQH